MNRNWEAYFSSPQPRVMGIVNLTPDSFHAQSRMSADASEEFKTRIGRMVEAGADIIDLGAESSRPGADYIDESEELRRLVPAIRLVRGVSDLPISIDTRRSTVAKEALDAGADIINDISAGRDDQAMLRLAADRNAPVVLMHMHGQPLTMQIAPEYSDVVEEVLFFLRERVAIAENLGVRNLIIDPGLGFGKNLTHNLQLLSALPRLTSMGKPVLIGHSRKSFIGQILAKKGIDGALIPRPVEDRLAGSLAVAVWSVLQGARIIRAHDVAETVDAVRLMGAITQTRGERIHA